MRILEMSDLHLEFNSVRILNKDNADLLILAGDIFVADYFNKTEASPKFHVANIVKEFFHVVCQEFENVIYILGNHEHYHGVLTDTASTLRKALPFENLHILNNDIVELNGIRFIGSTLWTECHKANPLTMMMLSNYLNDFKLIKYKKKPYEKFIPSHSVTEHLVAKQFISDNLATDKTNVVITHHGPSWLSIDKRYEGAENYHANAGYVSALEEFILDRDIAVWFHGHIHNNKDYYIGNTRVVCNPHGYNQENIHDFKYSNIIEVA